MTDLLNSVRVPRVRLAEACGVLIDVQEFFLANLDASARQRVEDSTEKFVSLCAWLRIPLLATVESPVAEKGGLPQRISAAAGTGLILKEKEFFDLTKHPEIVTVLKGIARRQVLVGGSETDVCVLQSVLGLIENGYEVFVVSELLFSSSTETEIACERLRAAGAVFVSLKTLFYELVESVESSSHRHHLVAQFGLHPGELP